VGATPEHKNIHDFLRHDGYFRTLGAPECLIISRREFLGKVTFVSVDRQFRYDRGMENASAPDLTAFVLAGGKSMRMGADKSFIEYQGRTFLARALDLARSVTSDVRIVGSREKFAAFAAANSAPVVEDIFRDCGPLAGIHAALLASSSELNLMLAVDTPFIPSEFLRFLITHARSDREAFVIVPSSAGRSQPLCAIYRREFAAIAENALRAGQNKIGRLFDEVPTRLIEDHELHNAGFGPGIFRNLNTPEELAAEKGIA
jgi:molybdopterin-guanine dinucleotide biosynthesis protein A